MKVNTAGLFSLAHAAPAQDVEGEIEIVAVEGPPPPPHIDTAGEPAPRMRKSTLEHFNEEMSVLERPLEGEPEFYDEPRPRRWRVPAIGAVVFLVSCVTYLGVLRHRSAAEGVATAASPAASGASASPVAASAPVVAAPKPAEPAPSEAPSPGVDPGGAAAAPAPVAAAAPVVADASSAGAHHHHHHHGRPAAAHHHHHGGHGHRGRA